MTPLFSHIKQNSHANSFVRQKYGLNCSFPLEDHQDKTKSIAPEIIGSLVENSPISLDVNGAWMSSVMNASIFTEAKLSFSFEGRRLNHCGI